MAKIGHLGNEGINVKLDAITESIDGLTNSINKYHVENRQDHNEIFARIGNTEQSISGIQATCKTRAEYQMPWYKKAISSKFGICAMVLGGGGTIGLAIKLLHDIVIQ